MEIFRVLNKNDVAKIHLGNGDVVKIHLKNMTRYKFKRQSVLE